VHNDLLWLLDAHLAEMQGLRDLLAAPRPVRPGERWAAALESAQTAQRYARAVDSLLFTTAPATPVGVSSC
jgi:alkanesulfonate monooxygenase SsuD/methylene tetrahydromethanopterin reductase-like flavin-dependent oxidoreductase (luciferase family)